MRLNKRMESDRAVFATLDRTEKLHFLWDYYKIPIIALGCVVLLVALSLITGADSRKTAMYAVFVNANGPEEAWDSAQLEELLALEGEDMTKKSIDITANLTLGQNMDEVYDGQTIQVLAALFGVSGLDLFAADMPAFERYAQVDAFMDLSRLLEPELLEAFPGDLYYYENGEGREILGGLILRDGSALHLAGYYRGDVVIGIANNAQNPEEALAFVRRLALQWTAQQ